MELFPAADDETWEFIKEQIDDSNYYIVLIAGRYGSIAKDSISFTEKEYDYARERGKPSIGFVHENRDNIPAGMTEKDPERRVKLDAFIQKVRLKPVRTFSSPHQLATEVTTSFVDMIRRKPSIGFVRENETVEYKKYAELLEKNSELEKRIRELKPVSIEAAYENHTQRLYENLVMNLLDRPVTKETEQEAVEKFIRGLNNARRAKDLALNATSGALPAKTTRRRKIKKK